MTDHYGHAFISSSHLWVELRQKLSKDEMFKAQVTIPMDNFNGGASILQKHQKKYKYEKQHETRKKGKNNVIESSALAAYMQGISAIVLF